MSQKSAKRILNDIKQYKNSDLKDNGIYVIFNEDNIYNCILPCLVLSYLFRSYLVLSYSNFSNNLRMQIVLQQGSHCFVPTSLSVQHLQTKCSTFEIRHQGSWSFFNSSTHANL